MPCSGGCLCDDCCAEARSFAFGQWNLDRPNPSLRGQDDRPLVSRDGYWYGVDPISPLYEELTDEELLAA